MEPICNRKISLISFDLDHTLLNSAGDINHQTLKAIRFAMDKGVKITISTGRVTCISRLFADRLNIWGPYVAANGALVVRQYDGKILFSKKIDPEHVADLCSFCEKMRLHYALQMLDVMYYTKDNNRLFIVENYNKLALKYGSPPSKVVIIDNGMKYCGKEAVYKIVIQPESEKSFKVLRSYLEANRNLTYTFSDKNLFDITANGISKGEGIKKIAGYYGISLQHTCAFGDYDNDLEIFRYVGTRIAMGNACENLKKIADFQTGTNDEDGIADAIYAMRYCFPQVNDDDKI